MDMPGRRRRRIVTVRVTRDVLLGRIDTTCMFGRGGMSEWLRRWLYLVSFSSTPAIGFVPSG